MSRIDRKSRTKGGKSITATVLAALLIGLFVALGMGPILSILTLFLPSHELPVKLAGRDQHVTSYIAPRGVGSTRLSYRTVVEFEDGTTRTLACREELYRKSLSGLRGLDTVILKRSILAGRPLSLSVTSKPLFSRPAVGFESTGSTEVHSLTMPIPGMLLTAAFCWGIAIYLMNKLRGSPIIVRSFYFSTLGLCAVLGTVWWCYSI